MKAIEEAESGELTPLAGGTIVGKHYLVIETLGIGSKSVVYLCRHEVMLQGAPVAVKLLHPSLLDDVRTAKRFEKELMASYQVTHPNVIRSFEYIADANTIGYSMEYAAGGSLRHFLREKGRIGIDHALQIATQICSGLQAIHAAGIIHRDLKPGNILFSERGTAKISDFGVALTSFGPRLTNDGELLGTVGYASPEYLQHGSVDERSDIYALGLIMYEMISGEFPFSGRNPLEALRERLTKDPKNLHEVRPDCPKQVAALVAKAMARSPEQRFQTAAEMLHFLRDLHARFCLTGQAVLPETSLAEVQEAIRELRTHPKNRSNLLLSALKGRRVLVAGASAAAACALFVAFNNIPRASSAVKLKAPVKERAATQSKQDSSPAVAAALKIIESSVEEPVKNANAPQAENQEPPKTATNIPEKLPELAPADISDEEIDAIAAQLAIPKQAAPAVTRETRSLPEVMGPLNAKQYMINRGDTLSELSLRFRIPVEKLAAKNGISNPDLILEGGVLELP